MSDLATTLSADVNGFFVNVSVLLVFIGIFCGGLAVCGCVAELFNKEARRG